MNEELKNMLLELYNDKTEYNIKADFTFKELFIIRDSLILFNKENEYKLNTENIINKINALIIDLMRG